MPWRASSRVRGCSLASTWAAPSRTPSSSPAGVVHTAKAPTTPDDQSRGVMAAVERALDAAGARRRRRRGLRPRHDGGHQRAARGHASRAPRSSPPRASPTSSPSGRQARRELYRLCAAHPAPLTPPERRFAARERTGPDGVLEPLSELDALVEAVAGAEPEAIAVCLLHSYRHPDHERAIGDALRARLAGVHVSLSHEVVGTFREFERAATTEVDAALSPLLARYLRRLLGAPRDAGLPTPTIMQSSGGLAALDAAADHAALAVLSGPAGGAAAAALLAERCGEPDLLCFDMGGTSCDVCVVEDGRVRETTAREVGGRPLALPMVDIHTVGAGGGSIGWRDPGGALRVGPAQRGRRARARVLRARRHRADGHRRQPRARPPERRRAAGRRRRARRATRRTRPSGAWPTQLGLDVRDCARGHRARGQRRDGPRAAGDDRRARHRPAALRPAGLRRRRAAARGGHRRRSSG